MLRLGKAAVLAGLGAATLAAAVPADAAVLTWRFTGNITQVNRSADPFGVTDVAGPLATPIAYVYDVTIDTSVGQLVSLTGLRSLTNTTNPTVFPISSWALTINGVTDGETPEPGDFYYMDVSRTGSAVSGSLSATLYGGRGRDISWSVTPNAISSPTANSPEFADPFVVAPGSSGGVRFTHDEGGIGYEFIGQVTGAQVLAADAVPEPATWAMLALGFGLVGAAARRRRMLSPA